MSTSAKRVAIWTTIVVIALALILGGAFFLPRWVTHAPTSPTPVPMPTTPASPMPTNPTTPPTTTDHNCPPGTHWGYGGNPVGLTPEEIEARSSCLKDGMALKPMIYLYPTSTTNVTVTVSSPGALTVSYPAYGSGWQITAAPDGTLTDASGNRYYGLYYESQVPTAQMRSNGFVVAGSATTSFLEDALATLGLDWREAQEFIVYWLPQMQDNPYNYIRFETAAEINTGQALTITPQPDTVIRVLMSWKPLTEPVFVVPQQLQPVERKGFTVVEWGGTIID